MYRTSATSNLAEDHSNINKADSFVNGMDTREYHYNLKDKFKFETSAMKKIRPTLRTSSRELNSWQSLDEWRLGLAVFAGGPDIMPTILSGGGERRNRHIFGGQGRATEIPPQRPSLQPR